MQNTETYFFSDILHLILMYPGFLILHFRNPFCIHELTSIPEGISEYIHNKFWSQITKPFPNLNGAAGDVREYLSSLAAFDLCEGTRQCSTQQCGIITFDVIRCLLQDSACWQITGT